MAWMDTGEPDSVRYAEYDKPDPLDDGLNTIANSYMVSIVNFSKSTKPFLEVLDSRVCMPSIAADARFRYQTSRDATFRLVVAEDLPRPTFEFLESAFGVDPELLNDHRRNGPGFLGQPDLDIDLADRDRSISVAMPFDLQVGPDLDMHAFEDSGLRPVEDDIVGLLQCHQLVNYLRYDWQTVAVKSPLPAVFCKTYRRLSIHVLRGTPETVLILMYPPLWNLKSFQTGAYKFHVSPDLRMSSTPSAIDYGMKWSSSSKKVRTEATTKRRTQDLVDLITDSVDLVAISPQAVTECLGTWIMQNVHGAFEYSIASSVKQWNLVKEELASLGDAPSRHLKNKELLEKFHAINQVCSHQMDKALDEIASSLGEAASFSGAGKPKDSRQKYIYHQWHRSSRSQRWLLEEIEQAMRGVQTELQLELTSTQIEESRKAIQQAETVKRLTALAFVFIPISAVCSAFGMNIQELNGHLPPVWIFVIVALGVTGTTLVCSLRMTQHLFWALVKGGKTMSLVWTTRWHQTMAGALEPKTSIPAGAVSIGVGLARAAVGHNVPDLPQTSYLERSSSTRRRKCGDAVRIVGQIITIPAGVLIALVRALQRAEHRGQRYKDSKELG